jgi:hypothetical protein
MGSPWKWHAKAARRRTQRKEEEDAAISAGARAVECVLILISWSGECVESSRL